MVGVTPKSPTTVPPGPPQYQNKLLAMGPERNCMRGTILKLLQSNSDRLVKNNDRLAKKQLLYR